MNNAFNGDTPCYVHITNIYYTGPTSSASMSAAYAFGDYNSALIYVDYTCTPGTYSIRLVYNTEYYTGRELYYTFEITDHPCTPTI